VLKEDNAVAQLRPSAGDDDLSDQLLAGVVTRVRLAGEDDLDRPLGAADQRDEPVDVTQQQRRPLVGCEATGEADGQNLGIDHLVGELNLGVRCTALLYLRPQGGTSEQHQRLTVALVYPPQLLGRDLSRLCPELLAGRLRAPAFAEVAIEALSQI